MEVDIEEGFIRVEESNEDDLPWTKNHSREIRLEAENNGFWIKDKYALFGWMIYENLPQIPLEKNSKCNVF